MQGAVDRVGKTHISGHGKETSVPLPHLKLMEIMVLQQLDRSVRFNHASGGSPYFPKVFFEASGFTPMRIAQPFAFAA